MVQLLAHAGTLDGFMAVLPAKCLFHYKDRRVVKFIPEMFFICISLYYYFEFSLYKDLS